MESLRERKPLVRRNSHPLCQDVREATYPSPTPDSDPLLRIKPSSPTIPYDINHSPPTPTFVDTRQSHIEHGFYHNGDALLSNLYTDMLDEVSSGESTRNLVKARVAEIESRQAQPSIISSRSSSSAFTMKDSLSTDWFSQSRFSYASSTQSSELESLTQMSDTQSLRRSMFPMEPISVDKMRNATKEAVEEAMPTLYDLNYEFDKAVPNFTQYFRENLHEKLKVWRERTVQDVQKQVLESEDVVNLGTILKKVEKWKEEPEKFMKLQYMTKTPESMLVMQTSLPKEVKKGSRYAEKEMEKLKDEEAQKRRLIMDKTAALMALVQRSEALVVAVEKVADVGKHQEMTLPAAYENILDPIVLQSRAMRDQICGDRST